MTTEPIARTACPEQLRAGRVIAILRGSRGDHLQATAHRLVREGIRCLELTTNTPGALEALRDLRTSFSPEKVSVGIGTARSAEHVDAAADAGADFIVSPGTNAMVGRRAAERGLAWFPGAATATEVETAWSLGAGAVKIFPAKQLGGPAFLSALRAPLDDVAMIPTGGVDVGDVASYLSSGALAVGLGSPLIGNALRDGDMTALAARCRDLVATITRWERTADDR